MVSRYLCVFIGATVAASLAAQNDLIISEYIEGSGHTKCIELYNPTSSSINLAGGGYRLVIYSNGSSSFQVKTNLSGRLRPGGTHVICEGVMRYSGANQAFAAGFNGDDAVAIVKGSGDAIVDLVGNPGCDPGDAWRSGGMSTKDRTLRRQPCVNKGVRSNPAGCSFATLSSEWIAYATNDLSGLGHHHFHPKIEESPHVEAMEVCDGVTSLMIEATGEDLEYSIDGGTQWQASSHFESIRAGDYRIVVRESSKKSCRAEWPHAIKVSEPLPPRMGAVKITDAEECGGYGELLLEDVDQKTYTLSYTFERKDNSLSNLRPRSGKLKLKNLPPGSYSQLHLTDEGTNCTSETLPGPWIIGEPEAPSIGDIRINDAEECNGEGSIIIEDVSRGSFDLHYEYNGKPKLSRDIRSRNGSLLIDDLPIGEYKNLHIVDRSTSCTSTTISERLSLEGPGSLQLKLLAIENAESCESNGAIVFDVDWDGAYEVSYQYEGELEQTSTLIAKGGQLIINELKPGNYSHLELFHVKTGCLSDQLVDPIRIDLPEALEISKIEALHATKCGSTGSLTLRGLPAAYYTIFYDYNNVSQQANNQRSFGNKVKIDGLKEGTYRNIQVMEQESGCLSDVDLGIHEITGPNKIVLSEIETKPPSSCNMLGGMLIKDLPDDDYRVYFWRDSMPEIAENLPSRSKELFVPDLRPGVYSHIKVESMESRCSSNEIESHSLLAPFTFGIEVIGFDAAICGDLGQVMINGLPPDRRLQVDFSANGNDHEHFGQSDLNGEMILDLPDGTYNDFAVLDTATLCHSLPSDTLVTLRNSEEMPSFEVTGKSSASCRDQPQIILRKLELDKLYQIDYEVDNVSKRDSIHSDSLGEIRLNVNAGRYSHFQVADLASSCVSLPVETEIDLMGPKVLPLIIGVLSPVLCGGMAEVTLEGLLPDRSYLISYHADEEERHGISRTNDLGTIGLRLGVGSYKNFSAEDEENECISVPADLASFVVVDTPIVSIATLINPSTCTGADGAIILEVEFIDMDYEVTYALDGRITTSIIRSEASNSVVVIPNLTAGTYTNIAVALNDCSSRELTAVLEDPNLEDIFIGGSHPTSCTAADGTLSFSNLPPATNVEISYTVAGRTETVAIGSSGLGVVTLTDLVAGCYQDIIIEFGGCRSGTRTATLSASDAPSFMIETIQPSNCGSPNGSIRLLDLAAGSYDVYYQYEGMDVMLSNQAPDASGAITIANLAIGHYLDLRVEQNGCTSSCQSVLLLSDNAGVLSPGFTTFSPSDCETRDASILIDQLQANTPYMVSYDFQGFTSRLEQTSDPMGLISILNLVAGTYENVQVSLGSCSSVPSTVPVLPPSGPPLDVQLVQKMDPKDCVTRDGSIELGTFGPNLLHKVSFSLSGGASDTIEVASDQRGRLLLEALPAGTYVDVKVNLNACQGILSQDIVLEAPMGLTTEVSGSAPSCNASDGELRFSMLPANASFVLTFDSMGVDLFRSAPSDADGNLIIGGLGSAEYRNIVVDGNGCLSDTMMIDLTPVMPLIDADILINPARCFDETNGFASVDATGTDLMYAWSHDPTLEIDNAINLAAGDYFVTVSQSGFCDRIFDFQVMEPDRIDIEFTKTDPTTQQGMDGALSVTASGGAGGFTFAWNTGETDINLSNLSAGLYSITVTDQNGCQNTADVTLGLGACDPLQFIVQTRDDVECAGDSTGRLVVRPLNGQAPFTFQWSHDPTERDSVAENLWAGTYGITATDANGCTGTFPFFEVRDANPPLLLDVETVSTNGELGMDGMATVNAMGGVEDYSFEWSTGATSMAIDNLSIGDYWVKVTDALGCTDSTGFTVGFAEEICRLGVTGRSIDPTCDQEEGGSITLQLADASIEVQTQWLHDLNLDNLTAGGLSAGSYEVVVNQGDICADTLSFNLVAPDPPNARIELEQDPCSGDTTSILKLSSGQLSQLMFTIDGNTVDPEEDIMLSFGSYLIAVEDDLGCSFDTTIIVTDVPTLSAMTQDTQVKLGHAAHLQAQLLGDTLGLDFGWRVGDTVLCSGCLALDVVAPASQFFEFFVNFGECEISDFVQVFVDRRNLFFIPNAFTPNNDGVNDHLIVHDGRNLVQEVSFVEVYDRLGRAVYKKEKFPANSEQSDFASAFNEFIVPAVFIYRAQVILWDGTVQNMTGDFTVWK